ncbi:hypothetical protein J2Z76_002716 [Sedimentibacter acidaminivorans]|uniref:Phage protein n=1 Tax=Sedimentibacter acidaminivorans TaxID=913099 RepID=A0ABS4GGM8_9FIRM|nr:phage tail assembly protein [Sedimentibacter acidaminivorans]MBP1926846.1 hypothetical protein [Sedimentibacter acidaminivorans]
MAAVKLNNPVKIDGKEITELEYNLDDLKADSIQNAIKDFAREEYMPTSVEHDIYMHAHLFSQASNVDYQDVKRMGLKDFVKVTNLVKSFLLEE